LETDVCDPGLDGAKREVTVVGLVRFMDVLPVIDNPSELDRGEVRGERESGPTQKKAKSVKINGTSDDTTPAGETRLTAL
jgi:hypothetical protein